MDIDIYLTGMSNTDAIRNALVDYTGPLKFYCDRLNPKAGTPGYTGNEPDPDFFREKMQAKLVALSLWGNWYNTMALIEHSEPFDFIYPSFDETVDTSRRIIPFTQLRRIFNNNVRYRLRMVQVLRPLTESKIVLLEVPPPIEDEEHIRKFPGSFREMLPSGITPARIRMKLWKLQSEIYEAICQENNIEVLPFPNEAKSPRGFIAPDYCYRDPTHANAKYGALVISQLETIHRSLP